MILSVYLAVYAGLILFVVGCLRRIYEYAHTPMHLRWELYPVPHEAPDRAEHGGSYFESANWFNIPQEHHRTREWAAMLQEIVFLKSLRENNPRLWTSSFLFHFGLYLEIGAMGLLAAGTMPVVLISGPTMAAIAGALIWAAKWTGLAGAALIMGGAVLLLLRRLLDPDLKNYTRAGDLFNLFFFLVTFVLLAAGFLLRPAPSATVAGIARGAVRFDLAVRISPLLATGLILASALIAYIPFTHMSHFIGKYFAWHAVRWDDRRTQKGGVIESRVAENLQYRPTWAAAHIGADGAKSWAEIASSDPSPEMRK